MSSEMQIIGKRIVARWQDWSGASLEHLELRDHRAGIFAEAAIIGAAGSAGADDDAAFAARYRILCDLSWRVREVEISLIGADRVVKLRSDGAGNWLDGDGIALAHLAGAIDVDISITPFTNTIPIRRLGLRAGDSAEIVAAYLSLPELEVTTDRQRYTCLRPMRCYRYESLDSDFTREIEVDDDGLVVTYPGLFRRVE
jgi:hypothetical protein